MATLSSAELDIASRFSTVDDLNSDLTYANQLSDTITLFVEKTDDLKGEAWDKEKANLLFYKGELEKQKAVAKSLGETIESALSRLLSAIAPDEFVDIDDESINEIKNEIQATEASIQSLNGQLGAAKKSNDSKRIGEIQSALSAQEESLRELKRMHQKMIDLRALSKTIQAELASAFAGVAELSKDIGGSVRV